MNEDTSAHKRPFQRFRLEEITDIRLEDNAREAQPLEMPHPKSMIMDIGSILAALARFVELIPLL